MTRKTGIIIMVIASAGLMGCPPQEEGPPREPEVYDIKDYWPMAEGNEWEWVDSEHGLSTALRVTDEFVSGPYTIWEFSVLSTFASTVSESFIYFVLSPDYLIYTLDKHFLSDLPDDPSNVDALDNFTMFMPSKVLEGRQLLIDSRGELRDEFTITGTIDDLTPYEVCQDTNWTASDFPVVPKTYSIMRTGIELCDDDVLYDTVEFWLARDVGPIMLDRYSVLTRALVDGVEYAF